VVSNRITLNGYLIASIAVAIASLVLLSTGVPQSDASRPPSANSYGFEKATEHQKMSLSKAARGIIKEQRAWFVNTGEIVRWGIVCGRGGPVPSGKVGSTFNRRSGHWTHRPPKSSGGFQTIRGVCESLRSLKRADASESRRSCLNYVNGYQGFPKFNKRKAISCKRARKIFNRARQSLGSKFPSACQVGRTARWNGWKITARGGFEAVSFKKGMRSFNASGGGRC
jgi:hypothetical protein